MSEKAFRLPSGSELPIPEPLSRTVRKFEDSLSTLPSELFQPIPFGMAALDRAFSGGVHAPDLTLVLGRQNVGKTIFILQIARNMALWSKANNNKIIPWVCCYEHNEWSLFTRLLCMESWIQNPEDPLSYKEIIEAIIKVKKRDPDSGRVYSLLFDELKGKGVGAIDGISQYFDNLMLYYARRDRFRVEDIASTLEYFRVERGEFLIPIIDYLQTIPADKKLIARASDPQARELIIKNNLEMLKSLCIERQIPMLVVAAVDQQALVRQGPVHVEDALGPEETNYTIDSAIVLNYDRVTSENISQAEGRKAHIRISIEKNRRGPVPLEWRHQFNGGSFYIDPRGEDVPLEESYQSARVPMGQLEAE